MIKIEIKGEEQPKPDRTVTFEFRRHQSAVPGSLQDQQVFLVILPMGAYPIKIDGRTGVIEVREDIFQDLGFKEVVVRRKGHQ